MGKMGKLVLIAIAAIAAGIFALPTAMSEGSIHSKFLIIFMLFIAIIVFILTIR